MQPDLIDLLLFETFPKMSEKARISLAEKIRKAVKDDSGRDREPIK